VYLKAGGTQVTVDNYRGTVHVFSNQVKCCVIKTVDVRARAASASKECEDRDVKYACS